MISGVTYFSFREENPNKQTRSVLVEKDRKKLPIVNLSVTGMTTQTIVFSGATNLYTIFDYGR